MLSALMTDLIDTLKIDPKTVDDVVIGNVLQPGCGLYSTRLA